MKISAYYSLTKPGIVYGNVFVAAAAFIFASHHAVDWWLFVLMLAGLSLVVGSACVFNNIADRALDARMARTAGRALAVGSVAPRAARLYGSLLLALGVLLLWQTNLLALSVALVGFVVYVFLYTPLKPRTGLALYVGALAGATPPLVGYVAAAGGLDWYAAAFFALMYLWQIPHFMAIARYRFDEYGAAGIPLLVREPKNEAERRRARTIFFASLVVLVVVCGAVLFV